MQLFHGIQTKWTQKALKAIAPKKIAIPPRKVGKGGRDGSDLFELHREDYLAGKLDTSSLLSHHHLLVGGLWSEYMPCFKRTVRQLERRGVSVEHVPHDTSLSALDGGHSLANYLLSASEQSKKGLRVICHSKGGVDMLYALLLHPSLRQRIQSIVLVQSPLHGAVMAVRLCFIHDIHPTGSLHGE